MGVEEEGRVIDDLTISAWVSTKEKQDVPPREKGLKRSHHRLIEIDQYPT
jgi:hypothetical protein